MRQFGDMIHEFRRHIALFLVYVASPAPVMLGITDVAGWCITADILWFIAISNQSVNKTHKAICVYFCNNNRASVSLGRYDRCGMRIMSPNEMYMAMAMIVTAYMGKSRRGNKASE